MPFRPPRNSGIVLHQHEGIFYYIFTFSPRGFYNELDLGVHRTLDSSLNAVNRIANHPNQWICACSITRREIRKFHKATNHGENDGLDSIVRTS